MMSFTSKHLATIAVGAMALLCGPARAQPEAEPPAAEAPSEDEPPSEVYPDEEDSSADRPAAKKDPPSDAPPPSSDALPPPSDAPSPAQQPAAAPPDGEPTAEEIAAAMALSKKASLSDKAKAGVPGGDGATGRTVWSISSNTYFRLFRRALLPGPNGALVESRTAVPIYEYASLRVNDIDAPWLPASVDMELAAWGNVNIGELGGERRRVDGDITVASIRQRFGPAFVRLGRQQYAGVAARYVRFDGILVGAQTSSGIGFDAYGGLTVLPRWSLAPGYHLLGSTADTLVRSPDALPDPHRTGSWLAGGRMSYRERDLGEVGVSFHEQREDSELDRRELGLDFRMTPVDELGLASRAVLDLDSAKPSDIRAGADVEIDELSVLGEYRYLVPSLFLSRQSVLSVFATDKLNEVGGAARYRLLRAVRLGAGAYVELFEEGEAGYRASGSVALLPTFAERLIAQLEYGRFSGAENGYHSIRGSVGYRVLEPLRVTAESYGYFYDEPIRDVSAAWVGALTGELSFSPTWAFMLGGSTAITPYAKVDAQLLARLKLLFEGGAQ